MNKHTSYRELKAELDDLMRWFEQPDIDIDEALEKYKEANTVISKIEAYLKKKEAKIKQLET